MGKTRTGNEWELGRTRNLPPSESKSERAARVITRMILIFPRRTPRRRMGLLLSHFLFFRRHGLHAFGGRNTRLAAMITLGKAGLTRPWNLLNSLLESISGIWYNKTDLPSKRIIWMRRKVFAWVAGRLRQNVSLRKHNPFVPQPRHVACRLRRSGDNAMRQTEIRPDLSSRSTR